MSTRTFGRFFVFAAVAALAASPTSGQDIGAGTPDIVVTAFGEDIPEYEVPRTPWGDPDLQGVWASDDMAGIRMSRPNDTDGLFLTGDALAERVDRIETGADRSINDADSTFRFDFARRAFPQTGLVVDPLNGQQPAITDWASARQMPRGTFGNGPLDWTEDFSLYERCITRGIAGSTLNVIYGNGNRIVQSPGMVAMSYEMLHDTRIFYMDGRPHLGQGIRAYLGDSRARWDGDTLVVETTNLTDRTAIGVNGNGPRHSHQMKMTEKFKRVADDVLQYQLTIDDPLTYEEPFTVSFPLTPLEGGRLLPYDCHEGNYAILQSLGAERYEDQALIDDLSRGIIRPRRAVQDGAGVGAAPARGRGARGRGAGAGGRGGGAGPNN